MESSVTACCVWRSDWLLGGPTEGLFFSFQRTATKQTCGHMTGTSCPPWTCSGSCSGAAACPAWPRWRQPGSPGFPRTRRSPGGGRWCRPPPAWRPARTARSPGSGSTTRSGSSRSLQMVERISLLFKKNTFHSEVNFLCSSFLTEKEHNPNSNHWSACFLTLQHELLHLFQLKHRFLLREATYNRRTRETARLTPVYGENLITAQTHSCAAAVEG